MFCDDLDELAVDVLRDEAEEVVEGLLESQDRAGSRGHRYPCIKSSPGQQDSAENRPTESLVVLVDDLHLLFIHSATMHFVF